MYEKEFKKFWKDNLEYFKTTGFDLRTMKRVALFVWNRASDHTTLEIYNAVQKTRQEEKDGFERSVHSN